MIQSLGHTLKETLLRVSNRSKNVLKPQNPIIEFVFLLVLLGSLSADVSLYADDFDHHALQDQIDAALAKALPASVAVT
ncbi:MAG: hypothetical protein MPJ24_10170, partial [Pirellulaceae bacterium]|nr:hypothetical protein [Pirellulaceae bacterium]